MGYSKFIKELRVELNLSQEELARILNVSFATINRWETGKNQPSKLAKRNIEAFCLEKGINYSTKRI